MFADDVAIAHIVDGDDIGMIQRGDGARFEFEALAAHGIVSHVRRQDLQGDVASEASVAGAVYFTHAARAEGRDDFVGAEFVAGRERHLGIHPSVVDAAADRFWKTHEE